MLFRLHSYVRGEYSKLCENESLWDCGKSLPLFVLWCIKYYWDTMNRSHWLGLMITLVFITKLVEVHSFVRDGLEYSTRVAKTRECNKKCGNKRVGKGVCGSTGIRYQSVCHRTCFSMCAGYFLIIKFLEIVCKYFLKWFYLCLKTFRGTASGWPHVWLWTWLRLPSAKGLWDWRKLAQEQLRPKMSR